MNAVDPMGLACCCPNEDQACVDAINLAISTIDDIVNDWSEIQLFSEEIASINAELGNTPSDFTIDEAINSIGMGALELESLGTGVSVAGFITTEANVINLAQQLQQYQTALNSAMHQYFLDREQLGILQVGVETAYALFEQCIATSPTPPTGNGCQCYSSYAFKYIPALQTLPD